MSNKKYWKVICRYGHVGRKKEVSVSRYLETDSNYDLIDVLEIISGMPGVKTGDNLFNSIVKAESISKEAYKKGKKEEQQNIYLQKLRTFHEFMRHV